MKKFLFLVCILLLNATITWAQREVSGQVVDNDNQTPIQGINVIVKNTQIGTTTDVNGNFRISVPSGARILVFTSSGYTSREVNLTEGQTNLSVSLSKSVQALQEVVVAVAYGEQERKKITGAVGKVTAKQIENVPMTSVDQILQGKVAGLQSVATSGQPGAIQQIRIRGIGSISASSAPLYVIDGIPVNSGDASNLTNSSNLLATINPNDIESVSVLKDASAASIYGSRAANGVILINTKKGRPGKTRVRLDAEFGKSDIAYRPEMGKPLNRDQVDSLYREGLPNAGFPAATIDFIMNNVFGYSTNENNDWFDLVTRQGVQQQINLSASGGDQKTQFYLSGGYFKQQSPVIGSELKRYSATINLKHQLSQMFGVGVNMNLSSFHQLAGTEAANFRNPVLAAMGLLPTQKAFNADGTVNYDPNDFGQIYNPLAIQQYDKVANQTSKFLSSAFIEFKPIDRLKVTSRLGIDYNNIEEYNYYNPFFGDFVAEKGLSANSYNRLYNWVWSNYADYDFHTMQNKLDGTVTAGYEAQQSKVYTQSGVGNVLPSNSNIVYPVPAVPTTASVTGSDYAFTSLFSRAQLNLLRRYSVSGSLRRDASSRFGINNRN